MNTSLSNDVLQKNLRDTRKAIDWLKRSFDQCSQFNLNPVLSDEQLDAFEALAGRYARASDMLVNKVFRSIDKVELEEGGSTLDVLGRAHKRRLFDSLEEFKTMRLIRNAVAHDYTEEEIRQLFAEILKFAPLLLKTFEKTATYCAKKRY